MKGTENELNTPPETHLLPPYRILTIDNLHLFLSYNEGNNAVGLMPSASVSQAPELEPRPLGGRYPRKLAHIGLLLSSDHQKARLSAAASLFDFL